MFTTVNLVTFSCYYGQLFNVSFQYGELFLSVTVHKSVKFSIKCPYYPCINFLKKI